MPLDPVVQVILDQMAALDRTPMEQLTAQEAREQAKAFAPPPPEPEPVAKVTDHRIPVEGGDILARAYQPEGAKGTLVYYHGGGWVLGDVEGYDQTCRHLANLAGCTVVSVDYRLAPEFPYPVPAEDGYAALQWVAARTGEFGGGSDLVAVGGDSAGGNLSAVVAQMARDRNGPAVAFQLLIYPVTDCNLETGSYVANATDKLLTQSMMVWFWDLYASPERRTEPYASPLRCTDLAGLPPALVMTAEYDPLCDEGEAYAAALQAAGVPVTATRYDGLIHGFFGMFAAIPAAQAAHEQAGKALRLVFRGE